MKSAWYGRGGMGKATLGADPTAALWRASQVFRLVTLAYAVSYQVSVVGEYTAQTLSWAVVGVMAAWSGLAGLLLTDGRLSRTHIVVADQVIAIAAMAMTRVVSSPDWYQSNQTLPTTLWVTNAVLTAAILGGPWLGFGAAILQSLACALVQSRLEDYLWRDSTAPMFISAGLAIGWASRAAMRAFEELQFANQVIGAAQERERLARHVHDGVLQVLAYVRRRGTEVGGEAAELARLAGEQEIALRRLIGNGDDLLVPGRGTVDLARLLDERASPDVVVATPGEAVLVPSWIGTEVDAAVANALANTALHAGPGVRANVLLEELPSEVIVTVRDDGCGIAPGRLEAAVAEGRMGVAHSIRGRIAALGGVAELITAQGGGTEWEFRIPKTVPPSQ